MKMKKKSVIAVVCAAVLVIIGVVLCLVLAFKGLLGFYHPLKKAKEGQIKVACVGDSVTYGFGITDWKNNNYPAQLQQLLGDGYCVNNFGYSGRCVQSSADRPYVKEALYRKSKDFAPDIVIFMLGSNDSKAYNWNRDAFIKDYLSLVKSYQDLPSQPKVYVMAPPPVFEVGDKVKYHIEKETIAEEIVPLTKSLSKQLGVECMDLYSLFEGHPEWFSDGCHPTAEGAGYIAEALMEVLAR